MGVGDYIKETLKCCAVRAIVLTIGIFYASLALISVAWKRITKGSEIWNVKERSLPPICLQDTAYGRHSFIKLKDIRIHYVENGERSKPLMLFVHGFPEFWFSWRNQLKHFSSSHWVVAMDMRGYGDSDKPTGVSPYSMDYLVQDICELVKALGREKCTLVAHDWGGAIAWVVAATHPELVEKLIILNAPHPTAFGIKFKSSLGQFLKSWYMFVFQVPYLPEIWFNIEDLACFKRIFAGTDNGQRLTDEELEGYKYTFSRKGAWTPPINYYRASLSGSNLLRPRKLPQITVPSLIIWGENDLALSKDLPELAKAYVNNLKIKYIPNANHFVQQDKPDDVNRAMEDFIG